ncbi:MAG: biotin--[acetyl-CoA-carboxylase] ligase [Gemmataceae bacterium]|nr:biotin--[acetyl-CoA-carboxylase] ligase [Gemmataceae bacterium]
MTTPAEEWHFPTAAIGRRVLVFNELASTNAVAADWPADDEADGLVVVARDQTAGRGRFGRVWRSRPGSSLLLSVIVCPPADLRRPVVLTAWAAVAVAGAVRELVGVSPRIKWPNDLLAGGKKGCGILIEQGRRTVAGVGLNLNQSADEFAAAGLPEATSLRMLGGREYDLKAAAGVVVRHLDAVYGRLVAGDRWAVEAAWAAGLGLVGRDVTVEFTDGATARGTLRAARFGGLEVETENGLRVFVPETVGHVREVPR